MGNSTHTKTRERLVMMVGVVLLAGGLLALAFPVFLDDYDRWGIQINCGNGYHSQLAQATTEDQVDQCASAVAFRRAWAIPAAGLGALLLVPQLVRLERRRATEPGSPGWTGAWSASAHPDENMHEAALLDRRERSHWGRSSNTTL